MLEKEVYEFINEEDVDNFDILNEKYRINSDWIVQFFITLGFQRTNRST